MHQASFQVLGYSGEQNEKGRESQQEIYDMYTTKYMIYKYVICNYVIHMYICMYVSYDERWE